MKRSIISILILFAFLNIWQACIDDESTGAIRELSKIDIKASQDTFYVDFGEDVTIRADVTQSGDGEMTYEWGWGTVNGYGVIKDSLKIISNEPVLHYNFKKLGQFKVRLRVTNEDGSSFYFFELYVRAAFQEGLLVLSEDENHLGRSSFLRVKEPNEIVMGNEEFVLHAFEKVNPEIALHHPKDVSWVNYDAMILLTDGGKSIHRYDRVSFDYLNTIQVDENEPGLVLEKFCLSNPPYGFAQSLAWEQNGYTRIVDFDMHIVQADTKFSPEERYDKIYFQGKTNHAIYINYEESYMNNSLAGNLGMRFTSGDYFKDRYIVNVMIDEGRRLHVITTDPQDPQKVTRTLFTNMEAMVGWFQYAGAFLNPKDTTYRASKPLTLKREMDIMTNNTYNVAFYSEGNALYQWIYKGIKLPESPLLTVDGEITCMCVSPDDEYLYLGIWNPSAQEDLKGSVYILEMKSNKIVRQYRGVADKPLKIMYKPAKD